MSHWLLAFLIAVVLLWPLRLAGRWLERKGRDIQRGRKGDPR